MLLSPSILAADFANLERDISSAAKGGADYIHVDVMDGHFVPNITIGVPVVRSLSQVSPIPLDVHLMIEHPSRYIPDFAGAGARVITVHLEAPDSVDIADNLREIRSLDCMSGLSVKPGTAVSAIEPYLELCDLVLIMTVEPGFGGQSFIDGSLDRIREARQLIDVLNPRCILEIDGGVDETNICDCVAAGTDMVVAGSAVFKKGESYAARAEMLKRLCN